MRILALFAFLIALFLSPPPPSAGQQALPTQPGKGQASCVAVVANASAKSAFAERMTERLTKSLEDNKLIALMMDSATTTHSTNSSRPLRTATNRARKIATTYC